MSRYHINPATGEPGACRARVRCPFGDMETDHFPSAAEARRAYELRMNPVKLSSFLDLDLLRRDMAEGYIDGKTHPEDPDLWVLCYSKTTQYEGHWTEATKVARGLILRSSSDSFEDAVVEQRPWRKFFTLEQMESGWHLGDEEGGSAGDEELAMLDFNAPAEVTDKVDGSMGVLYLHPDGRPALSTKGSFASDQANYYSAMLRNSNLEAEAMALLEDHGENTFLFEMVGRGNRIVLDYPEDGIVLLGAVRKHDGLYRSANDYAHRWSGGVTETMEAATVGEALALPDRPHREGVVIRVLSSDPARQMQLKVKQDDYKQLHRIVTGFGAADMRESIRDSGDSMGVLLEAARSGDVERLTGVRRQLDQLAAQPLLEGVYQERREAYERLVLPRLQRLQTMSQEVSALPDSYFQQENPAKTFAASIAKRSGEEKADLFNFFQARLSGRSPEEMSALGVLRSIAREVKADTLRQPEE